jgi:hypothetical protein
MNKTMMIMIVGSFVIGMVVSVTADEEILPITISEERKVESDDIIITPNPNGEPLIIAPNPDETISHNVDKGERGLEEPAILPNSEQEIDTIENGESNEVIDAVNSYATIGEKSQTNKITIEIPVLIIIGTVIVLLVALLIYKRIE